MLKMNQCKNSIEAFSIDVVEEKDYSNETLFLCGTNYFNPTCTLFQRKKSKSFTPIASTPSRVILPDHSDVYTSSSTNLFIVYSQKSNTNKLNSARIMKFNYRRDRKQLIQNFNYKLPDHKSVKFLNSFSSGKKFFFIYNEFNSEEDYSTRIGQICQSDIFEPQLLKNKHQQSQNRISSTMTPKTFIKSRFTCNSSTRPAKIISLDLSNNKIFSLFTSNNSVFICSYGIDQINLLFSEKKLVSLLNGGKISSERRKLLGDCDFKSLRSNPILPKPQNHENLSMFSVNQKTAVTDQNFSKNNFSEMNSMNKTISAKNQIPKTTNPLDQQLIENKILGNLIFINDLNSYSSQISSFSGRIIGNYNEIILGFNNGSFITYTTPTELFKSGSVSSDNFKIFQGNSSIHSNKFRDMKIDKIATSSNSELNIFRNSDHSLQAVSQPTANCSFAKSKNCARLHLNDI